MDGNLKNLAIPDPLSSSHASSTASSHIWRFSAENTRQGDLSTDAVGSNGFPFEYGPPRLDILRVQMSVDGPEMFSSGAFTPNEAVCIFAPLSEDEIQALRDIAMSDNLFSENNVAEHWPTNTKCILQVQSPTGRYVKAQERKSVSVEEIPTNLYQSRKKRRNAIE